MSVQFRGVKINHDDCVHTEEKVCQEME